MDRFAIQVPSMIAEYFIKHYGDLTELSGELLNDALKSIIQQEAKENKDARKIFGKLYRLTSSIPKPKESKLNFGE